MIVSLDQNIKYENDAVVVIGNFDGVHLGHQYLFNSAFELAKNNKLKKICITFEPHPKEYFSRQKHIKDVDPPKRITLLKDKINILYKLGFDLVWVIKFNKYTAELSPIQFINKIISNLNIRYLLIGKDFKFGKGRAGDSVLLEQAGQYDGFKVVTATDYLIDGHRVSSNRIRQLLSAGELALVRQYLGRDYGFTGKVVEGQRKGTQIGYPTININVKPHQLVLSQGVYAVLIEYKNKKYKAMGNWGVRPTLCLLPQLVLEAHIFNFAENIYGHEVIIEFIEKVRNEKKFGSLSELKLQLAEDARVIKNKLEKY